MNEGAPFREKRPIETRDTKTARQPGWLTWLLPRTLVGRLIILLVVIFGGFASMMSWNEWRTRQDLTVRGVMGRNKAVAASMGLALDGLIDHEGCEQLKERGALERWEDLPPAMKRGRDRMADLARANGVSAPVGIMRLRPVHYTKVLSDPNRIHPEAMEYLVSTTDKPNWRDTYEYRPEMFPALFAGTPSATRLYTDRHGQWVSAYATIPGFPSDAPALLAVDSQLDELLVRMAFHSRQVIGLAASLFLLSSLLAYLALRAGTYHFRILTQKAEAFGAGDYETAIPTIGPLETHQLGATLDQARRSILSAWERNARLVDRLKGALRKARQASETKSEFLANMSHEIRTPLNGVIGMAEIMINTDLTEEQREYATTIRDSGGALLQLLGDVLDFSKIEAGKMELERLAFDVRDVIREVTNLLSVQCRTKDLSLESHVDDDFPERIVGDPGRLRQILFNLAGNAVKFTEQGKVEVSVRQLGIDGDALVARFEIQDTGIGIPEEARSRLFQPFEQADASNTRRFGGTGLGLAISRRLVSLMRGEIGVKSPPESGSTFWFTVRLELPTAAGTEGAESAAPAPADPADRPAPLPIETDVSPRLRILVAEDRANDRRIVTRLLKTLGHRAIAVEEGQSAVEAARAGRFDVILLDGQTPEVDGVEVARRIREDEGEGRRAVIIGVKSDTSKEATERAMVSGMDDVLDKPLTLNGLARKLDEWTLPAGVDAATDPA